MFETGVAPLLSKHCLECHDSATAKGGLDLSKKAVAMSGGESGKAIVAGKPADSILWQRVAADEMPPEGPALAGEEKELLRQWVAEGAEYELHWSLLPPSR